MKIEFRVISASKCSLPLRIVGRILKVQTRVDHETHPGTPHSVIESLHEAYPELEFRNTLASPARPILWPALLSQGAPYNGNRTPGNLAKISPKRGRDAEFPSIRLRGLPRQQ